MTQAVFLPYSLTQLSREGAAAHPVSGAQNSEARRQSKEPEDLSEDDQSISEMERDIRKVMRDSGKCYFDRFSLDLS